MSASPRWMSPKNFKLAAEQILELTHGHGECRVSDRVVVDGCHVGFMYREHPMQDSDSGWRFLAGDESDDYLADDRHMETVPVNTVANYDRDITPLLDSPVGKAY